MWPDAPERPSLSDGEVHVWRANLDQTEAVLRGLSRLFSEAGGLSPPRRLTMEKSVKNVWVASYHKPNPRAAVRLFCFPYAGGGASVFAGWMSRLSPDIEVCPVQLPGRENRLSDPPLTSAGEAARLAVEALAPYFDMPFAFFGHSLGALVAYESAQALRRAGGPQPRHLIISARRAPQLPPDSETTWQLPDADFRRRLEELDGTPKEVLQHEELLALILPLLRADFRLAESYTHPAGNEPLDCPVAAFGGRQDTDITEDELAAWRGVTRGGFSLKMLDGGHFFIHSHAAELMSDVSRVLLAPR
jgi:surfactin synthase thioesterase subunit